MPAVITTFSGRLATLALALGATLTPAHGSAAPGETHALLVGCSEYPELAKKFPESYETSIRLTGPVNDVELVQRGLVDVLGVDPAHIAVLAGWPEDPGSRPTRRNILKHLDRLSKLEVAGQGEFRVVIYLAGHGSQQRAARGGADEPDGMDEVFLPADARAAPGSTGRIPNAITDDELGRQVRRIRDSGADVWLIVDACHSGTLVRGADELETAPDFRLRRIPAELLGATPEVRSGLRGGHREKLSFAGGSLEHIVAMYGAQSYGSAPEMTLPRHADAARQHGLFTYLFVQELTRTRGETTFRELGERIVAAYQAFPCRITIPVAEGDLARHVGTGRRSTGYDLLVSVLPDGTHRLNAGRLAGIESGTQLELLSAQGLRVALVVVENAWLHESSCRVLDGTAGAPGTSLRARLVRRAFSGTRVKIGVTSSDGRPLAPDRLPEFVREYVRDESCPGQYVRDPAQADWFLIPEGETLRLRPSPRTGGEDRPGIVPTRIGEELERLAHARNLKLLASGPLTESLGREIEVWIERRRRAGESPTRLFPGDLLHPADEIRVMLRKTSSGIYDVGVFFIDANDVVQPLFPRSRQAARLEGGATAPIVLVDWVQVTDDALGIEHIAVFAFPRSAESQVVPVATMGRPLVRTRGAPAGGWIEELQRTLGGANLRGLSFTETDVALPRSTLITLQTDWPELGPPPWPERGVFETVGRPALDGLEALPVAIGGGTHGAFLRTPDARNHDAFVAGDPGEPAPRAVWIDLDGGVRSVSNPAEALGELRPDAMFYFGEREWVAYYDGDGDGAFELGLVDRDRDARAEERWDLGPDGWRASAAGRAPWLSQIHLAGRVGSTSEKKAASKSFTLLARPLD